ncbi:transketolase [Campylobacter sp. IFREMER_LSEM_CL2127]|uniref:transketolase family protein n=1 Tax=Campylobacter sp. IFREMER_LSEM_CL2127 TaxID=2911619 RepID=UPI0021E9AD8C|nr:transketolase [Campylobacter sp. IFREMER_LSEM_CL2127]MCV3381250.1 transketolase [Campylobacter sp. IFREMER_LSEM_CL2127]
MSKATMRDVFLNNLFLKMQDNNKIMIVTADFGAPSLDKIREKFPERVINVGIAEQNAINISVGLALEGYIVYIYAIAPFISMRCFEQIRVNIAILNMFRHMNINIIGVGVGMSYSTSGPTHHCLEDLSLMKTLPNIDIFSPSDCSLVGLYVEKSISINKPKYIRLDGEAIGNVKSDEFDFDDGFRMLNSDCISKKIAVVSTGYMSNKICNIVDDFENVLFIDMFLISSYNKSKLLQCLLNKQKIITLEEGFIGAGGLDSEINSICNFKNIINLGLQKKYCLEVGSRDYLHKQNKIDLEYLKLILEESF